MNRFGTYLGERTNRICESRIFQSVQEGWNYHQVIWEPLRKGCQDEKEFRLGYGIISLIWYSVLSYQRVDFLCGGQKVEKVRVTKIDRQIGKWANSQNEEERKEVASQLLVDQFVRGFVNMIDKRTRSKKTT